mgnify:CR=1 FL=1
MLDDRKVDDREGRGHQGQREHVPDIRLASPLVVDGLGDPVEDCDDPDGGQGAQEEQDYSQVEAGFRRMASLELLFSRELMALYNRLNGPNTNAAHLGRYTQGETGAV